MDDPRSELESMLSSSIDAELPFALGGEGLRICTTPCLGILVWATKLATKLRCQGQCFRLHLRISLLSLSLPGTRQYHLCRRLCPTILATIEGPCGTL